MPDLTFATRATVDTVVPSAARTASGDSGPLAGYGGAGTLRAQLEVTARSGVAPTLDVVVEDSLDGGATWNTVGTFAQATAVGRQVVNVTTPFAPTLRVRWTLTGTTPSFTFSMLLLAK